MKVVKIGSRQNMLQLQEETGTSWYKINDSNTECLEVVKNLSVNDEVEVQFNTTNGIKVINELSKTNMASTETKAEKELKMEPEVSNNVPLGLVGTQNNFSTPVAPKKYACKTCGAALKDDKYETCYTCSMKARNASGGFNKSPEVQDSIKRQAIGHMTSRTLIALQGSSEININNLESTMEKIYRKYQQLVG